MARPLTMSQLEQATGVGRDTIHYYISEGLLPPGQKASARRVIYDRSHVELLQKIRSLKAQSWTLREIRDRLDDRIRAATERGVDLVARESEAVRAAILEVAARRFAERAMKRPARAMSAERRASPHRCSTATFPANVTSFCTVTASTTNGCESKSNPWRSRPMT